MVPLFYMLLYSISTFLDLFFCTILEIRQGHYWCDVMILHIASVAGGSSRRFFDKLNKIAKNLKIFMEIDLIKYYHLIFFS